VVVSRPHGTPYEEEERLYAPPRGSFDPEWAVRLALAARPGLAWPDAYRLAEHAWRHLRCSPQLSVDELVDYTAADEPDVPVADVAVVVQAAVDFCEAFAVEP
jgi:hypothetical protein